MEEDRDLLVGLDIGDRAVKLIQLRREEDGFSLEKLAVTELGEGVMRAGEVEEEDRLVDALRELIQDEQADDDSGVRRYDSRYRRRPALFQGASLHRRVGRDLSGIVPFVFVPDEIGPGGLGR